VLNNLAWLLATTGGEAERALDFANRAVAAGEDATRLDTLAAALANAGRFDEAAAVQERALALNADDGFARRLEEYRAGRPWRVGHGPAA
jgi:tetratricopeptide (TPR) repeat protein